MNEVHQRHIANTTGALATPALYTLELNVPEFYAARLRAFEMRIAPSPTATNRVHVLLAKGRVRNLYSALEYEILSMPQWIAVLGFDFVATANSTALLFSSQRVELWDYDYRLVANPTLAMLHSAVVQFPAAVLFYELVPCTEEQRNAIIAYQGDWGRR